MALAKQCDRCGKWYKHYPTGAKIVRNAIARVTINAKGEVNGNDNPMDFCEDCMSAFDKFMIDGGRFDDKT